MKNNKYSVWIILWRWSDGSGSGLLKTYHTKEAAEEMFSILEEHGNRCYEIIESEVEYA